MDILKVIDFWDKQSILFIDQFRNFYLDQLMTFVSGKYEWIPFYMILLYLIYITHKVNFIKIIFLIAGLVAVADVFASKLCKPYFERLRPCHQEELFNQLINFNNYCGGSYGFISSHAANTFAIAMFLFLLFNKNTKGYLLFLWAFIVSFSRVYLAVHFPSDIIVGAASGLIWGSLFYYFFTKIKK